MSCLSNPNYDPKEAKMLQPFKCLGKTNVKKPQDCMVKTRVEDYPSVNE